MSRPNVKTTGAKEDLASRIVMKEGGLSPGCDHCDTVKSQASDTQADLVRANARIKELEEQVSIMSIKATSAGK